MTWEYRLAQKVVNYDHPLTGNQNTVLYGIVEVYYDKQGRVEGWTDFINPNGWEDVDDLRFTLEKMLSAFGKPMFEEDIKEDTEDADS